MPRRRRRKPPPQKRIAAQGSSPPKKGELLRHPWIRSDGAVAVGLTLLAWAHRLFFLHSNRDATWPFTIFYQGDAKTFFLHARALLSGELYDSGIPFHPPGFPAVLAALHSLLGAGDPGSDVPHLAVKTVLALVSSGSVGLVYLLARPYVGRMAALAGALLCTYHFGLLVLAVAPVSEGLYTTLLLAALLLYTRRLRHPLTAPGAEPATGRAAWRPALGLGVLFGLLALLKVESVLLGVLLGALGLGSWLVRHRRAGTAAFPGRAEATPPGRAEGVAWLLVAVGWWLPVLPWTLRNAERLGDYNRRMEGRLAEPLPIFVPVTIYGPLNLALANHPDADGTFSPAPLTAATGGDGLDFTRPDHLRYILHGDALAWGFFRDDPETFLRRVVRKWALASDAFRLGFGQWNWPGGLVGERRPVDVFVPDRAPLGWLWPALLLLGGGLAAAAGGGPRRLACLATVATGAGFLVIGLFYGYVRHVLLLLPFWAPLMAYGVVRPGALLVDRLAPEDSGAPRRPAGPGTLAGYGILAGSVVLLLWVEGRGVNDARNYVASASSTVDGVILNADDTVRLEVVEPP
ncbi:MAG: hypothetical protein AAGD06_27920 [Acidobacteriota bacterium]